MTIMGITAQKHDLDISGLQLTATKEMTEAPRRVKKVLLHFTFPKRLSAGDLALLTAAVKQCPVSRSLNPEVQIAASFQFADEAK